MRECMPKHDNFLANKSNLEVTEFFRKMLHADLQDIENMSSAPAEFTREWKPCKSIDLQGFFYATNVLLNSCL